jgi:hypothetical protein
MATAAADGVAADGAAHNGIGCPSLPCHVLDASSEENVRQCGIESR